jgi:S1-C subfamily serine protease
LPSSLGSFSEDLALLVAQTGRSVVAVHARSRFDSSGLHWSPGVVVTAAHAIRREEEIRVTTAAGTTLDAELAGRDSGTDLAVLRVKGLDVPTLAKEESSELNPGQIALAVGRSKDSAIAALGLIGSLSPASSTWRGGRLDRVIRLSLELHPGGAGGAVVNAEGKLLGVATHALSRFSVFAIPPGTVDRVSSILLTHGGVPRGYLGVGLQPIALPEHLKNKLGLAASTGLIVMSVDPEAAAGRAGVALGDILIELGGKAITRPETVQEVLDSDSVGKAMPAKFLRGGEVLTLDITVGQRPRRG